MVRREQFSGHTPEDNGIDGDIVHNGSVGGDSGEEVEMEAVIVVLLMVEVTIVVV